MKVNVGDTSFCLHLTRGSCFGSVCLSVCLQINAKNYGQILMTFNVDNGTRNKCIDFSSDPDHCLVPGIVEGLSIILLI